MTRDEERYNKLSETIRALAQHIDWLTPFLSAKAKESGNVAGLQLNATEAARDARGLINVYEAEDRARAWELAKNASDVDQ